MLSEAGFSLAVGDSAQAAVPLWQRALTLSPDLPEAHLGMALAAAMQGNMTAAEIHLNAAPVNASPRHESGHIIHGAQRCCPSSEICGALRY